MGFNVMKMMQQVQDMQKKAGAMQEELSNLEITGESGSGSVKVTLDGRGKFKSIKIAPEAINAENPSAVDADSIEILEDLIAAAIQQADGKATNEMQTRLTKITGGVKIPGLSGLGF